MTDFTLKEFPELDSINEADIAPDDEGLVYDASVGVVKRVSKAQGRIDRTVPINSVASFADIDLTKLTERQGFFLISFGPSGSHEGGPLYWSESEPRTNHDGRYVFSPTVPAPADFNSATDVQDYRDGVGDAFPGNNGCFIRAGFDQWVIPLPNITSLSSLNTAALVDGQQFDRLEFWPDTGAGFVKVAWRPNEPVANHNGGTIIDPAKISELDTVNKTFGTYFTPDTVSGNTGCFVVNDRGEVLSTWFGLLPDTVSDMSPAANAAQKAAEAAGLQYVDHPAGDIYLDYFESSLTQRASVNVLSGVVHRGSGRDATTFKAMDGSQSHVFLLRDSVNSGVIECTVDGSRASQSAPPEGNDSSGVLVVGTADGLHLENLFIHECFDYGLGLQVGRMTNSRIRMVTVQDVGADGLDFKNTLSESTNNIVEGVFVRRFGLGSTGESFAGIDIRGEVDASHLYVEEFSDDKTGIRIMPGESGDSGGAGGHRTTVSQFRINGTVAGRTSSKGLHCRARECQISNGVIAGSYFGAVVSQRESHYSNITITGCQDGLFLTSSETSGGDPLLTGPDSNGFANLTIRGCSGIGARISGGNQNTFVNAVIRGNGENLRIDSGTGNGFSGGDIAAPTGLVNVDDNGTRTKFRSVVGVENEARIQSVTFSLDSTGVKTVTVPHGLDFTPDPWEVSGTLLRSSPDTDYEIGFLRVASTDSTDIVFEVDVVSASSTLGAVSRLSVSVATKT